MQGLGERMASVANPSVIVFLTYQEAVDCSTLHRLVAWAAALVEGRRAAWPASVEERLEEEVSLATDLVAGCLATLEEVWEPLVEDCLEEATHKLKLEDLSIRAVLAEGLVEACSKHLPHRVRRR